MMPGHLSKEIFLIIALECLICLEVAKGVLFPTMHLVWVFFFQKSNC